MRRTTFLILLLVIVLTAFSQEWDLLINLYTHPDTVRPLIARTSIYGSDMYDSTIIVGSDTFVVDKAQAPPPPSGFWPFFPIADSIYSFLTMLCIDGRSAYDDTIIWTIRWYCDYTESVTVEWDSSALPGYGSFGIEVESPRKIDGDNWIDMSSITRLTGIPFWSSARMRFVNTTGITEETGCNKPNSIDVLTFPNPFNSAVRISFCQAGTPDLPADDLRSVGQASAPVIEIFDIAGRMVADLPVDYSVGKGLCALPSGGDSENGSTQGCSPTEVIWSPDPALGSGVYLVRAIFPQQTASAVCTKRVVYLK